jgi:DNA-binding transcriptional LysR family regulator
LDLSSLEIFIAVAAEQGVTRAALHLGRAPSNVTTRVKHLEEELGAKLFLRDGKRMVLTENGARFLGYARQLLTLSLDAREAVRPEANVVTLRIGAVESAAAVRLPSVFAALHRRWPGVGLEVSGGTSAGLIRDVLERKLDCAFVARTAEQVSAQFDTAETRRGLRAEAAFEEEVVLVLPASHGEVKTPEDIKGLSLATFSRGCAYRELAEQWFDRRERSEGGKLHTLELPSYHAILACVVSGFSFTFCPRSIVELNGVSNKVKVQQIASVKTWLVCRSDYHSDIYRALSELVNTNRT